MAVAARTECRRDAAWWRARTRTLAARQDRDDDSDSEDENEVSSASEDDEFSSASEDEDDVVLNIPPPVQPVVVNPNLGFGNIAEDQDELIQAPPAQPAVVVTPVAPEQQADPAEVVVEAPAVVVETPPAEAVEVPAEIVETPVVPVETPVEAPAETPTEQVDVPAEPVQTSEETPATPTEPAVVPAEPAEPTAAVPEPTTLVPVEIESPSPSPLDEPEPTDASPDLTPTAIIGAPGTEMDMDLTDVELVSPPESGEVDTGAAVGIVFGALAGLGLLFLALFLFTRWRRDGHVRSLLPSRFQGSFIGRSSSQSGGSMWHRKIWPPGSSRSSANTDVEANNNRVANEPKTNTAIIDQLTRAAYDADQGRNDMETTDGYFGRGQGPNGYMDEKAYAALEGPNAGPGVRYPEPAAYQAREESWPGQYQIPPDPALQSPSAYAQGGGKGPEYRYS